MSIVQIPLRLTSGAFILNSGINKLKLTEEQAAGLQQMAANGVPQLSKLTTAQFKNFIIASEIGTMRITEQIDALAAGDLRV